MTAALLSISVAHNNARLDGGTRAFADLGPNPSRIQYFATVQPATGAAPGGAPLVEMILAKPCGVVVANRLQLVQADSTGDQIMTTGAAVWGRWLNGNGDLVGDGPVSDDSGTGFFKIAGTAGTTLYAGARAILGTTAIA